MTNRNEGRMGAPNVPQSQPEQKKSLLDFVSPTQFVVLPSKGKGYPEGHPLKDQETIEVRYMTAKDEDILSSQHLLKQGIAIDRFLENVLMDKKFPVDSLLIGDKNAIIIDTRMSGYGNLYETALNCPACGKKNEMTFDLNNKHFKHGELPEGVSINEKANYVFVLPVSGVEVEVKLLTSKDEKKMIKKVALSEKNKMESSIVTDQYKMMIVSAQGETNKEMLSKFVDLMPIEDSKVLRNTYKAISPNVEIKEQFTCFSCEHSQELEVPFGADFFWPGR